MTKQACIKIELSNGAEMPKYQTNGAAGFDLCANFNLEPVIQDERKAAFSSYGKALKIKPYGRVLIKTGIKVEIPEGYELQIRPRSGLALKKGLLVSNSPGTVDEDYRGDIGIILTNCSGTNVTIMHGDRIAQAILSEYTKATFEEVRNLSETKRGAGGFGHTGGL